MLYVVYKVQQYPTIKIKRIDRILGVISKTSQIEVVGIFIF